MSEKIINETGVQNLLIREDYETLELIKEKNNIIHNIYKEIPFVDIKPYSHNIISLNLRILADKFGDEEAIKLIENSKLKDLGWADTYEEEGFC